MIVVTGATGALNGATVDHLLTLVPADQVAVAVRDPARAQRFADRGVAVRPFGGYADATGMRAAFAGADQLLLVSSNDPGADAVALHGAAVEAAVAAGVGRVLYTSHQGAAPASPFAPAAVHARTEDLLDASGLAWTSLRNGFYAHSLAWLAGPWRETGVVTVPADGPWSWTWRDDVAEAAAVVIASDGGFDGPTTLTAADAVTFGQVAEIASQVTGRDIGLAVVGDEAWRAQRLAAGAPEFQVDLLLGGYRAGHDGLFAGTDPLLGTLLGRPPRTVHDLLAGA